MTKITFFTMIIVSVILVACTPVVINTPTTTDDPTMNNPVSSDDSTPPPSGDFLPSPADSKLRRDTANLESTELLTLESYPLQFTLVLNGNLPTPCNHLRIAASPPNAQNKIEVDVYSVIDPNTMCTEVIQPFEVNFPLGSFPTGHYTLWINGQQITEFDA